MKVFNYTIMRVLTNKSLLLTLAFYWMIGILALTIPPIATNIDYHAIILIWNMVITTSLVLFIPIIIAMIVSRVISEEIDDGTSLLVISKPITRNRIWVEKMVAIILLIICTTILTFGISVLPLLIPTKNFNFSLLAPYLAKGLIEILKSPSLVLLIAYLGVFSVAAFFLSAKNLMTFASLILSVLLVCNFVLVNNSNQDLGIIKLIGKIYVWIPMLLVSLSLLGVSWWVFSFKNFT